MLYKNCRIRYTDEMRQIPDDNLNYPVLVKTVIKNEKNEDVDHFMGSGVFFRVENGIYFATAKHVIYDQKTEKLNFEVVTLRYYGRDTELPSEIEIDLKNITDKHEILSHAQADVIIIKIGERKNLPEPSRDYVLTFSEWISCKFNNGVLIAAAKENFKVFKDVMVSNDVFLLGYPSSLKTSGQFDPQTPLIRKGIVAGKNTKTKTILIDCPVYQGNSGGPVFQIELMSDLKRESRLIGLAIEMVPFFELTQSIHYGYTNVKHENSGYGVVVPIDFILELIEEYELKNKSVKN